jgi:small subunit ribosomal protein S17
MTNDAQAKTEKVFKCLVTSDKMQKSRVGTIERLVKHPLFGKYVRRRTKLMFHDETNETKTGDEVLVKQSRPLSGRKKFTLVKVIRKSRG